MEALEVIKKLQLKDESRPVLILNAPEEYKDTIKGFKAEIHTEAKLEKYNFIQIFGTSMVELKALGQKATGIFEEDGLLWLCYPKKSSKKYKGTDCNRDDLASVLSEMEFQPVRMVAIDNDWSALRFRHVDNIKTMTRKTAVTEKGKKRIEDNSSKNE